MVLKNERHTEAEQRLVEVDAQLTSWRKNYLSVEALQTAVRVLSPPVPRKARLMAFAIVFDEWLVAGRVRDYTEQTEITGMDRSAVTRIMNLRLLDPGEQEDRLSLN